MKGDRVKLKIPFAKVSEEKRWLPLMVERIDKFKKLDLEEAYVSKLKYLPKKS